MTAEETPQRPPRFDGGDRPSVVIDCSALFDRKGQVDGIERGVASGRGFEELRAQGPMAFGYFPEDALTIAITGTQTYDRELIRQVVEWVTLDPGFTFAGGVIRVARFFHQPIDYLVHGEGFNDYGYRGEIRRTLLIGSSGLETWRAISTHIAEATGRAQ
ncbi:hypothetical protein ACSBPH_13780 [Microbacterium sp. F51-2R]|uniref:hypothetical protein n=1 Tax=Microbacterium sp. F51-2R TaxID=3445777 RepID=UPI003F9ED7F0